MNLAVTSCRWLTPLLLLLVTSPAENLSVTQASKKPLPFGVVSSVDGSVTIARAGSPNDNNLLQRNQVVYYGDLLTPKAKGSATLYTRWGDIPVVSKYTAAPPPNARIIEIYDRALTMFFRRGGTSRGDGSTYYPVEDSFITSDHNSVRWNTMSDAKLKSIRLVDRSKKELGKWDVPDNEASIFSPAISDALKAIQLPDKVVPITLELQWSDGKVSLTKVSLISGNRQKEVASVITEAGSDSSIRGFLRIQSAFLDWNLLSKAYDHSLLFAATAPTSREALEYSRELALMCGDKEGVNSLDAKIKSVASGQQLPPATVIPLAFVLQEVGALDSADANYYAKIAYRTRELALLSILADVGGFPLADVLTRSCKGLLASGAEETDYIGATLELCTSIVESWLDSPTDHESDLSLVPKAACYLMQCLVEVGDRDSAVSWHEQIGKRLLSQLESPMWQYRVAVADALLISGRAGESLEIYNESLQAFSVPSEDLRWYHNFLGWTYFRIGKAHQKLANSEIAIANFDMAARYIQPSDPGFEKIRLSMSGQPTQSAPVEPIAEVPMPDSITYPGKNRFFYIGTGAYKHSNIWNPLPNVEPDGDRLRKAFAKFGYEPIASPLNPEAKDAVRQILDAVNATMPGDQTVIYIAGHADANANPGLAFHNTGKINSETPRNEYLAFGTLTTALSSITRGQVLLILDVCYGGDFLDVSRKLARGPTRGAPESASNLEDFYSHFKSPCRFVIASSDRKAFDGEEGEGSPFAREIIKALTTPRPKTAFVSLNDLTAHLQQAHSSGDLQTKPVYGHFGGQYGGLVWIPPKP